MEDREEMGIQAGADRVTATASRAVPGADKRAEGSPWRGPGIDSCMSNAVTTAIVVLTQLAAAGLTVAVQVLVTGGFGLILPVVAIGLGGGLAMLAIGSRRTGWPDRVDSLRLACQSGVVHWGVGALAYTTLYLSDPTGYDFGPSGLFIFAPVLGLLPGGAALVLTLCAGDSVRTALGISAPPARPATRAERRHRMPTRRRG